jgi:hypothetical protein
MKVGGHWYRIRLDGSALGSPFEQERVLQAIISAMGSRSTAAAAKRAAGEVTPERPARIYAHREDGVIVWYLDDGALALYRVAGGTREPDAHVAGLPDVPGLQRLLNGRHYPNR